MIRPTLGIDWADIGKGGMGGLHVAGRTLAASFGGGAGAGLADQSEGLQERGGLLPDWAKKGGAADIGLPGGGAPLHAPTVVTVDAPDKIVIVHTNDKMDGPIVVSSVVITGGKRFDGDGKRFSFGYDAPSKIDVTMKSGQKLSNTDVKQILFAGGQENQTRVAGLGDAMNAFDVLGQQIVGELTAAATALGEVPGEFDINDTYEPVQIEKNVYLHGTDIIGATTKPPRTRAGFVIRTTPRGRTFTSLVVTPKKGDFKASAKNARDVGQRAIKVATHITKTLNRLPTKVHGLAPKRQALRALTVQELKKLAAQVAAAGQALIARGDKLDKTTVVTEAKNKTAELTTKAKMFSLAGRMARTMATPQAPTGARAARTMADARRAPLASSSTAASRAGRTTQLSRAAVLGGVDRYDVLGRRDIKNYGSGLAGRMARTIARHEGSSGGSSGHAGGGGGWSGGSSGHAGGGGGWSGGYEVLGLERNLEILGAELKNIHYEILGDAVSDQMAAEAEANAAFGPRPGEEGAAPAPAPSGDWGDASFSSPSATTPPHDPSDNYGVGPAPKEAPIPETYAAGPDAATDQTNYNSKSMPMPAGIVYYHLEKGMPRDGFGSYTRYYDKYNVGYTAGWGGEGYYWGGEGEGWYLREKDVGNNDPKSYIDYRVSGDWVLANPHSMPANPGKQQATISDFGPLVGNPNGWTNKLRFDIGRDCWFWYWNDAPEWANDKVAQKMLLLQQAQTDWQSAVESAKTDYLAAQAQDKLDAQLARDTARGVAADDAAFAHTQSQVDQQQMVADQQQAQQSAALDAKQAELAQQSEAQYGQLDIQQSQLALQEQAMMLDFFKQNPSAMFAQGGEEGGQGEEDEGVDWGGGGSRDEIPAEQGGGDVTADELMDDATA